MVVTIEWAQEALALLPERAALLVRQETLLVADAHVGKAASFRRLGVPVPRGSTGERLDLLSAVIARTGARHLVFLGDFLHSVEARSASTLEALAHWRHRHAGLAVTLVRGNHDQRAGDPPAHLGFEVVEEPLHLDSVTLCHHPHARPGAHVLAGHLHPCIRMRGRAHDSLRLPCFHFSAGVGVLPAFGAFTGMHPIRRLPDDRVFAIAEGAVVAVP